jgi:TorA maturation chaperone TorD
MAAVETLSISLSEEDALRAQIYRLLAFYLRQAPDLAGLDLAAGMSGDDSALGQAINGLARVAKATKPDEISQEYHNLFIGVGRGELLPYASYYLTGFLNEKPLAKLRNDMSELGIERQKGVKEPEDHMAALCEMMVGLIENEFGAGGELEQQKRFFAAHLSSWARHFFTDLEAAQSSVFYAMLGSAGKAFIDIEEAAFEMV